MSKYGLLYNLGSGKSKEAKDLISYDNTSGDKIIIEVAADIGAAGLATSLKGSLDVAELATLTGGFTFDGEDTVTSLVLGAANNTTLPTQGYVDDAVAGAVTAGTITYVSFSMANVSALAEGKVVAIGADGPILADVDAEAKALAVGVISDIVAGVGTAGVVKVQIDGEATLAAAFAGTVVKGGLAFVRAAGAAGDYAGLADDEWISQLGIVTDVAGKKLILQPRVVGQKAV